MSLIIKAAIQTEDGAQEFRRFKVSGDEMNFSSLKRKIDEIFPDSTSLMWKDGDGDMVTFSSDEELNEALMYIADAGVLKIFVTQGKQTKMNTNGDTKRQMHLNQMTGHPWKMLRQNAVKPGHIGWRMKSKTTTKQKRFNTFDEDSDDWFKRRQMKWMNHLQKRDVNEETRPARLQNRLNRLQMKLADMNLNGKEAGEMRKGNPEQKINKIQNRIEFIKTKLSKLNENPEAEVMENRKKGNPQRKGDTKVFFKIKMKDQTGKPVRSFHDQMGHKFGCHHTPMRAFGGFANMPRHKHAFMKFPVRVIVKHQRLGRGGRMGGGCQGKETDEQRRARLQEKLQHLEDKRLNIQRKLNNGCEKMNQD